MSDTADIVPQVSVTGLQDRVEIERGITDLHQNRWGCSLRCVLSENGIGIYLQLPYKKVRCIFPMFSLKISDPSDGSLIFDTMAGQCVVVVRDGT